MSIKGTMQHFFLGSLNGKPMDNDRAKRILITGCGGPLGVNVTRSLRQAPEPLLLHGTDCNRYHLHLALTDRSHRIPPAAQTSAYLDSLLKLIEEEQLEMILPTHPLEVRTISAHRSRFTGVRLFLPEHRAIELADNKWETYRALQAAGLLVPTTYLICSEQDLQACFAEIPTRPIWVRGSGAPGIGIGVASLPCRELCHAIAWVDHWQGWGGFIASQYLPGRNLTWCGLFQQGKLIACQSRERLEYIIPHVSPSGITGAPAVSRTIKRDDVRLAGEAAVRVLTSSPNGIFFVDFKEDEDGAPRITEINAGRFGTTIHFYTAAGCNFPYLAVRLAFAEAVAGAPLIDPLPEGLYWIRTIDCGPVLVTQIDHDI